MSIWTPVTPRTSRGLVHATSLTDAHRTLCNLVCAGWKVAISKLSCSDCKDRIHLRVKRPRRRKKK